MEPSDLSRYVHAIITKRGRAMHTMLDYITSIVSRDQKKWDETAEIKTVSAFRDGIENK